MRSFGVRSAIYTNLYMWRSNLISKEEAKQKYLAEREAESRNVGLTFPNRSSVNNDLESFCENLRNANISLKREEVVQSFLTQELTADELLLVKNHNEDYAKTLSMYYIYEQQKSKDQVLEDLEKSGSPDSKFLKSFCQRQTFLLQSESILVRVKQIKIAIIAFIVIVLVTLIITLVPLAPCIRFSPLIFFRWPNVGERGRWMDGEWWSVGIEQC